MTEQLKILGNDVVLGATLAFLYRLVPYTKIRAIDQIFQLNPNHRKHEMKILMQNHLRFISPMAVEQGLILGLNDFLLQKMYNDGSSLTLPHRLLCGALAGGVGRMFNFLSHPSRLYAVPLAGASVFRGIQLGVFGSLQTLNPYRDQSGVLGCFTTYLAIQTATLLGVPLSIPFNKIHYDVLKTGQSPAACWRTIMNTYGWRGLYRGFPPRVNFLSCVVITTYDRIQRNLKQLN